jgi:2-polyprenyl-3-methyl-5-hydroxy-6-metoxy-1,4-benzoquinol methylase
VTREGRTVLRWARRHGDLLVAWEGANRNLGARLERGQRPVRTRSFSVFRRHRGAVVLHRIDPAAVDNDIAELIAEELVRPGLLGSPGVFERCFAGVVTSTDPVPIAAWRRFYANTLRGLRGEDGRHRPASPIAVFREIYRHAEELVRGRRVLDTGSCFAFFPLLIAQRRDLQVTASDREPGSVALARQVAADLGARVAFRVADVVDPLPFPPESFDTVTALHLLEHLPPGLTPTALAGLCAVARRRVVLAVPLERRPDPVYGHLQAFDLRSLLACARALPGWRGEAHERFGGWLVLDRRSSLLPSATAHDVRAQ